MVVSFRKFVLAEQVTSDKFAGPGVFKRISDWWRGRKQKKQPSKPQTHHSQPKPKPPASPEVKARAAKYVAAMNKHTAHPGWGELSKMGKHAMIQPPTQVTHTAPKASAPAKKPKKPVAASKLATKLRKRKPTTPKTPAPRGFGGATHSQPSTGHGHKVTTLQFPRRR